VKQHPIGSRTCETLASRMGRINHSRKNKLRLTKHLRQATKEQVKKQSDKNYKLP
jgi:hypothetical protein